MIDDLVRVLLTSIVTGLILCLFALLILKYFMPNIIENQKENIKNDLEMWINSPKGREAIYLLGGLAASGMKSGLGITQKGGKMKLEDIGMQLISRFISGDLQIPKVLNPNPSNQPKIKAKTGVSTYNSKY